MSAILTQSIMAFLDTDPQKASEISLDRRLGIADSLRRSLVMAHGDPFRTPTQAVAMANPRYTKASEHWRTAYKLQARAQAAQVSGHATMWHQYAVKEFLAGIHLHRYESPAWMFYGVSLTAMEDSYAEAAEAFAEAAFFAENHMSGYTVAAVVLAAGLYRLSGNAQASLDILEEYAPHCADPRYIDTALKRHHPGHMTA